MSEIVNPEPSNDEVEELIDDLEAHSVPVDDITDACTNTCICTFNNCNAEA